jgi:hypothetical protein
MSSLAENAPQDFEEMVKNIQTYMSGRLRAPGEEGPLLPSDRFESSGMKNLPGQQRIESYTSPMVPRSRLSEFMTKEQYWRERAVKEGWGPAARGALDRILKDYDEARNRKGRRHPEPPLGPEEIRPKGPELGGPPPTVTPEFAQRIAIEEALKIGDLKSVFDFQQRQQKRQEEEMDKLEKEHRKKRRQPPLDSGYGKLRKEIGTT